MINILTPEFIQSYSNTDPKFTGLAWVTYETRYSRWIEEEQRQEKWFETVGRVVNGNFALELARLTETILDHEELHQEFVRLEIEAKQAYDDIFYRRWLPAGRGLWCSGTDIGYKNGACLTNCFYVDVKPVDNDPSVPFCFAFDMLMLGAGVGFGVYRENIDLMPSVLNKQITLDFRTYADKVFPPPYLISDSREGWVEALRLLLDAHFNKDYYAVENISFSVENIRPKGARIKGFGGKASGPEPLIELLTFVNNLLNKRVGQKLSSVDITDIMTYIGRCVVAGNVRRSAMIALGDADDQEFIEMKNKKEGPEYEYHNWAIDNHRWASNNSIIVNGDTDISSLIESVMVKGEPGFVNLELARFTGRLSGGWGASEIDHVRGVNPCGEIALESFEPCNLVEVFPTNCTVEDMDRAVVSAYRYAKRVTLAPYPWKQTQEVVSMNRRIGISISGIQEWLIDSVYLPHELDELYDNIFAEDQIFSEKLKIEDSIKLTTIKPSGTISLLADTTPGMHWPHSEYYIRRMQLQNDDPIIAYLKECGIPIKEAAYSPNAVVASFPMKSKNFKKGKKDIKVLDQIRMQELLQRYWADNQVSCTVTVLPEDQKSFKQEVEWASQNLKSSSFLPYDTGAYEDMPYEEITKEQYEEMMSEIIHWPNGQNYISVRNTEQFETDSDCKEGNCSLKGG